MQAEQTDQQNQRDDGEDDRVRNHDRPAGVQRIAQDGGDRIEFDEFILDRVEIDVVPLPPWRYPPSNSPVSVFSPAKYNAIVSV
jgi:hypothetical protein